MEISVVIPVHNEEGNVIPLLQEIIEGLAIADAYEVIFVNDGSTDQTSTVLTQAMQHIDLVRVIQHVASYGQSTAIHTGVKAARYPVIATLDGDGQNDPADIPRLFKSLTEKRQHNPKLWMVAGWRNKRHDSTWRLISSKVANGVRSTLLGDRTPDTGCGLKVFLRDKFLELPYFDHMHRFLPALMIRAGGEVISEPVAHRARSQGISKYGTLDRLWVGIIDLLGVMWLKQRAKRPEYDEYQRH